MEIEGGSSMVEHGSSKPVVVGSSPAHLDDVCGEKRRRSGGGEVAEEWWREVAEEWWREVAEEWRGSGGRVVDSANSLDSQVDVGSNNGSSPGS